MQKYVIAIDQSTQGTKMLLLDENGSMVTRLDRAHRQIISEQGYVSHDMTEVWENILSEARELVSYMKEKGLDPAEIGAVGISNQRETTVCWGADGKPFCPAVVWQCGRAAKIAEEIIKDEAAAEQVKKVTGITPSPFFPAAKMRWLLENDCKDVKQDGIHLGTVDSYLVYRMTGGKVFATDASNASRTQLMDIDTVTWSPEMLKLFGVSHSMLPEILDSNGDFGATDFEGILPKAVPIRGVLGDSHAALYGQGCHGQGMMKTTYGTGSSMMLNVGTARTDSTHGLVSSVAWKTDGTTYYVLEGNINYTGAVISWLKDDLGLIASAGEVNGLCAAANPDDTTVVIPAFTGLSAPYWENNVKAAIMGMSRTTKKAEVVRAAVESIAEQVTDVFEGMQQDFRGSIDVLRADGGPTKNEYLMQLQSDLTGIPVMASRAEELSAIGAGYLAGISEGVYDKVEIFKNITYTEYLPATDRTAAEEKRSRWADSVSRILP